MKTLNFLDKLDIFPRPSRIEPITRQSQEALQSMVQLLLTFEQRILPLIKKTLFNKTTKSHLKEIYASTSTPHRVAYERLEELFDRYCSAFQQLKKVYDDYLFQPQWLPVVNRPPRFPEDVCLDSKVALVTIFSLHQDMLVHLKQLCSEKVHIKKNKLKVLKWMWMLYKPAA